MDEFYYNLDAPNSLGSAADLSKHSSRKLSEVNDWLESQDAYTLHKPIRKKFRRRKTISLSIDHLWQLDLADVSIISRHNDNYKFILTCIDCFSRFAFAVPVKNKSASEVKDAFASIICESDRRPTYVQTDKGREFLNAIFLSYLKDLNILHYTSENDDIKCALVERFNRTLKGKMWKYFTYSKSMRFIDVLPQLIHSYNTSYHRSIKMAPSEVGRHNESQLAKRQFTTEEKKTAWKFNIGDTVRIVRNDNPFHKGYEGGWSKEVFIVRRRFTTDPKTYEIEDYSKELIKGKFYAEELQRVKKDPSVFNVEKILRTQIKGGKKQYLVRWEGYAPKFDSWVDNVQ